MAISLSHFNLEPNRTWYWRVNAGGSSTSVELYISQSDAQSQTNRVAHATANFGTDVEVTLTQDDDAPVEISFFQSEISYHLKVTSAANDGLKIFRQAPFTDLPPIGHAIYRNFDLAQERARVEIGLHANVQFKFDVNLGLCTTFVVPSDQILVQSDLRNLPGATVIVDTHRIVGSKDSLTSFFSCTEYRTLIMA